MSNTNSKDIIYMNPLYTNHISRYTRNRTIYNPNLDKAYLESTNQYDLDTDNSDCIYHIVEQNEANRLDIIANNYYGDPSFYWVIAMANDMIDPFIVKPNTMLTIPSLSILYEQDSPLTIN
nr:MAG TPA: Baseplate wedge protein [Caudoviricetes sp.]